jgi:eukaryotic-like serine/threonine-protein kinase
MSAWVVPGYTEERELGRGASGRVMAAIHDASGQEVAIKYLAPRLFRDPGFLAGFREEAEVLRSLDVPQVVRLFDYVEDPDEGAAIVMELVNGVSLHQMISREGSTSPESALVVLKGSLLGLASAHQLGIVHRDYKPENVLVDGVGDSKLTDFGVAVKAGKKAPAAGTPLYMAPEQWNGAPATPATDIYAATAVFFECLTGKTPFSGRLGQLAIQHETAAVPIGMVEEPLQQLIERGMAKDPRDRPRNAMEFVGELNWVADRAYGADWEERGRSELGRRAAALLLLLLGGAVAGAAGGSFTASALAALSRRKKVVIAGAAAGVLIAIAAAGTTLALQGNNTNTVTTTAGSNGPSTGGGTTNGSGSSTTPGSTPSGSAPTSASPTPSASATTTTPAGNPTTTNPAGNPTTTTPAGNPTTANPPTTAPPTTKPPTTPAAVIAVSVTSPNPVSGVCPATLPAMTARGTISADRATSVTYHWARSNGTSSAAVTKSVAAGGSVSVSDSVTPASDNWEIGDTLTVTAPSGHSATAKLAVQCSPVMTVSNPGNQSVNEGSGIKVPVTASGGNGTYRFSLSGPSWMSLSTSGATTTVIGTAPSTDTSCGHTTDFLVTVTVTDTEASPQTKPVSFTVTAVNFCPPIT